MVGPTAQIAALTGYLNARLRGLPADGMTLDHSTCHFCEHIDFQARGGGWFGLGATWKTIANTPEEWLDLMRHDGATSARLLHTGGTDASFSDRMMAGLIGGGGRWLLAVMHGQRADMWEAAWEVGNPDAPNRRIWRVRYSRVARRRTLASATRDLAALAGELRHCLEEIETFARRQDCSGFADAFRKALNCLEAEDPFALVYHRDLLPPGAAGLPAMRLLAACQAAWVFGGMGSWNDMAFDGDAQSLYERLSDRLYALLTQAICAGANATAAPI